MKLRDDQYKKLISQLMKHLCGSAIRFNMFVKLDQHEETIVTNLSKEEILERLEIMERSAVLDDLKARQEIQLGENEYLSFATSGIGHMNPVIIHLKIDDNKIRMILNAAEGIVKQKTNAKLLESLKFALEN